MQNRYKPGDQILTAKPLVQVLYSNWKGKRCDYCFRQGKVQKCIKCGVMFYCNKICQELDWNPCHRFECRSKFHEILHYLEDLGDKKGQPKWQSVQIKLAFRYLIVAKLIPETQQKQYQFPDGPTTLNDIKVYRDVRCGSLAVRVALIWTNILSSKLLNQTFGDCGKLFYTAVSLADKFQIRITDTSLSIYDLSSPEVLLGEALYPELSRLMGYSHSCIANAAFTFDGTVVSLHALTDIAAENKIKINYLDVVGTPQGLLLPTSVRNDNIYIRGMKCDCNLCLTDTWEQNYENVVRTLQVLAKGELQFADTHVAALSHLIDKFRTHFGKHHPTITLMLYRMAFYQAVKQRWSGMITTLRSLLEAIAITHSNCIDQIAPQISQFIEIIEEGTTKEMKSFAVDFFKKRVYA